MEPLGHKYWMFGADVVLIVSYLKCSLHGTGKQHTMSQEREVIKQFNQTLTPMNQTNDQHDKISMNVQNQHSPLMGN